MCGIAGVMSQKLGFGELARFKDLYTVAQLRGDVGAGIAVVPKKEHTDAVRIQRTTWSSGHLVTTADYEKTLKGDTSIILGHARAPTRGEPTIKNVHPHRAGHIVLIHNGTMNSVDGKTIGQKDSDSKLIAEVIAAKGPQGFVNDSYGAYALVWIDLQKQTLNFLRNRERTLYFASERELVNDERFFRTFWASEWSMLQFVLCRYTGFNKDKWSFEPLPPDQHWEFPLQVGKEIVAPKVTKCERVYKWQGNQGSYTHGYYGQGWEEELEQLPRVPAKTSPVTPTGRDVIPFKYTPPEHRQRNTGVDDSRSYRSVADIVARSKAAAVKATDQKDNGGPKITATFPDLEKLRIKDDVDYARHVEAGACVWCSETPGLPGQPGACDIYPIKHTSKRDEYVCAECVKDETVQHFIGAC